jgi:hypothetical protein
MRDMLVENTDRFARGLPANNALLWGARGMGKSSLVKAVHASINAAQGSGKPGKGVLKLVEIHREDIETLPQLMALLRAGAHRFIVFCDDLSFETEDTSYKSLKAMLEGGIEGRPGNVVFYATSNRRHLMARDMMENERSSAINPGEAVEEKVLLSDRLPWQPQSFTRPRRRGSRSGNSSVTVFQTISRSISKHAWISRLRIETMSRHGTELAEVTGCS